MAMGNLSAGKEPSPGKASSGKAIPHKTLSAKVQSGKIFSIEESVAERPATGRSVPGELSGKSAPADNDYPAEFAFSEDLSRNTAIFCSDERFIDASIAFLKNTLKLKKFDLIVTAGGPAFIDADVPVLMRNLNILKEEHNISTLVLISHEDCKYYCRKYVSSGHGEIIKYQQKDLQNAKRKLLKIYPGLEVKTYFARIAGSKIIFENQS
jgi:hypothetical protein